MWQGPSTARSASLAQGLLQQAFQGHCFKRFYGLGCRGLFVCGCRLILESATIQSSGKLAVSVWVPADPLYRSICVPVCLYACLSVCLPDCLTACLFVYPSVCFRVALTLIPKPSDCLFVSLFFALPCPALARPGPAGVSHVSGCQNYGPFLVPYYNTAPII